MISSVVLSDFFFGYKFLNQTFHHSLSLIQSLNDIQYIKHSLRNQPIESTPDPPPKKHKNLAVPL